MGKYTLMHQDLPLFDVTINEDGEIDGIYNIKNFAHIPFNLIENNIIKKKNLENWISHRTIPTARLQYERLMNDLGINDSLSLILSCNGLSLSDSYWFKAENDNRKWKDINFFQNSFSDVLIDTYLEPTGFTPNDKPNKNDLYNPSNTANGNLPKWWKIENNKRYLIKGTATQENEEAYNEVIASKILDRLNIKHIKYEIHKKREKTYSKCEDYINENTEYLSATNFLKSYKFNNQERPDIFYKRICRENGLNDIDTYFDNMLIFDFIIANNDRHWNNFGVVRNSKTLEFIETFPIFDNGNSLYYNSPIKTIGLNNKRCNLYGRPYGQSEYTLEESLNLVNDFSYFLDKDLSFIPEIIREKISLKEDNSSYVEERIEKEIACVDKNIEFIKKYALKKNKKNTLFNSTDLVTDNEKSQVSDFMKKREQEPKKDIHEEAKDMRARIEESIKSKENLTVDSKINNNVNSKDNSKNKD